MLFLLILKLLKLFLLLFICLEHLIQWRDQLPRCVQIVHVESIIVVEQVWLRLSFFLWFPNILILLLLGLNNFDRCFHSLLFFTCLFFFILIFYILIVSCLHLHFNFCNFHVLAQVVFLQPQLKYAHLLSLFLDLIIDSPRLLHRLFQLLLPQH